MILNYWNFMHFCKPYASGYYHVMIITNVYLTTYDIYALHDVMQTLSLRYFWQPVNKC